MDKSDVSLIVSICSLFISLCGLAINYHTRSTKKKLILTYSTTKNTYDRNSSKIVVTANNTGNRAVTITKLGIGYYKKELSSILPTRHYCTPYVDSDRAISGYEPSKTTSIKEVIEPHHTIDVTYPFYNYIHYKLEFKKKLYVFAEDADGKSYRCIIDIEVY